MVEKFVIFEIFWKSIIFIRIQKKKKKRTRIPFSSKRIKFIPLNVFLFHLSYFQANRTFKSLQLRDISCAFNEQIQIILRKLCCLK